MSRFKIVFLFCLLALFSGGQQGWAAEAVKVIVGVPPYAYLAERIGGEYLNVNVLLAAGQDPHTFEASPKQVMSLGGARIFFSAGMEFEKHLLARIQANFSGLDIVDLSKGLIQEEAEPENVPNKHDDHYQYHDPHIWLSPTLLLDQAATMAQALEIIDPDHSKEYLSNLLELQNDLRQVRERIALKLAPFQGRSFLVYHPAFSYFGKDFGLEQIAVEVNGSKPSPKQLASLLSRARREEVKIVFVQPQFDQASAEILASSIGGAVLSMDPLAKDVVDNFSRMADKLEKALR